MLQQRTVTPTGDCEDTECDDAPSANSPALLQIGLNSQSAQELWRRSRDTPQLPGTPLRVLRQAPDPADLPTQNLSSILFQEQESN